MVPAPTCRRQDKHAQTFNMVFNFNVVFNLANAWLVGILIRIPIMESCSGREISSIIRMFITIPTNQALAKIPQDRIHLKGCNHHIRHVPAASFCGILQILLSILFMLRFAFSFTGIKVAEKQIQLIHAGLYGSVITSDNRWGGEEELPCCSSLKIVSTVASVAVILQSLLTHGL